MSTRERRRLETFTESDLPDLDEVVLGALDYLGTVDFPRFDARACKMPLVVGSGNALQTGKLLFRGTPAYFTEEGNALSLLKQLPVDALYIISASGEKHATVLAKEGVASQVPTYLITAQSRSSAGDIVGEAQTYVFPHIREPYTYNTSTYLSMLFGIGEESPSFVRNYIDTQVAPALPESFSPYNAFMFILPPEFEAVRKMFEIKFDELFGPHLWGKAVTTEEFKHAKTVVTTPTQCFIYFGDAPQLGSLGARIHIPLPLSSGPAALIAAGYYIIGRIQKAHPPYFKQNIAAYTKESSEVFGHTIPIIVE